MVCRIEAEFAEIGGEDEDAVRGEQTDRLADERHMVALHVKGPLHPFGGGKGRGIEEDQIPRGGRAAVFASQSRQSAWISSCRLPPKPFSSRLRRAHSR